ncbi:hypothetical protein PR202_ga26807 [Eleusine coracana subsp. coracana]|uniref:VPS37 C-terminal domain-containing protein n=1 Tax=Eleusine coracana subsp. coracana TaxID=191504 RepID=A0AAV5DFI5_ELECO|nr:hypothetical protein PR202_ga26807 [Eleusine coracana subsp. coracana]
MRVSARNSICVYLNLGFLCSLYHELEVSSFRVRDELRKETLQLAKENLEKEQRILELRNQCTIIRTSELAAAQDRLSDLERQKDEIMRSYSPAALLDKLQASMAKLDEESEELHQKFLEKDIDLATFVQKYKKIRTAYHKQALLHLAGKTSLH